MYEVKSLLEKTGPASEGSFWKNKENLLFLAVILVVSFTVFLPSLQNKFVNWDDNLFVYENQYVTDISSWGGFLGNAKGIFASTVAGGYTPLVILSFSFEKMLYGLDSPSWWHLNNIILHLINVLLVFRIAQALELKLIPAAFCALLFGIHPMRVESVAWIAERRDVLYGAFYLFALYYYIKSVKLSFQKRYLLLIISSFILALLSKIQAVALPLSMLAVDYYFNRKLSPKLVFEKWLYFLLSFGIGLLGLYLLNRVGVDEVNEYYPLSKRIFFGSYAYVIYLMKSIFPYEMLPLYPFPRFYATTGWFFYVTMLLVLSVLGATYSFFLKKNRVVVFGLLFFTFNVMFVLQIKIGGKAFLADRYTYIAYFGLFFIYASGLQWLLGKYEKSARLVYAVALLVLGGLGWLNFQQNKIWKNGETLWSHELKSYGQTPFAWEKRANYYDKVGRTKEALNDYSEVIALNGYSPRAYDSRGLAYVRLNMFDKALGDFNEAIKLDPKSHNTYRNRSILYFNLGQYEKAQSDLEKYLKLKPEDSDMWANLGTIRRMNKDYNDSINAFNRAIQINHNKSAYFKGRAKTYTEMRVMQ